ncbi:DUF6387 family protein [Vibrio sp. 10N.239.311.G01]|uniref:DUF6387 family protein n=1 Tax=Vibrio sp. 10N.239.311.G01 TaxID=3229976 RepID=UPI00354B4D5E
MNKKYYTKHAVLADKLIDVPCSQAFEQIKNWFLERDYCFISEIDASKFIREIEIRLHILQTLTFHQLYISPSNGCEMQVWKRSCKSGATQLTDLLWETEKLQGSLVSLEKAVNLSIRGELAKQYQEPLIELTDTATLGEIESHVMQEQLTLSRHEYLCPVAVGDKQVLVSIDLSGSDKAILDELAIQLPKIRKILDLPEPTKSKAIRYNAALKSFSQRYVIQYLDLLIYRIQPEMSASQVKADRKGSTSFLRPKSRHLWDLTDLQIANLIAPLDLDAADIKEWRQDTYEEMLLNSEYMTTLLRDFQRKHPK